MEFVENYVNIVLHDILGDRIPLKCDGLKCYKCENERQHSSIYCEKHEDELGNQIRLQMVRENDVNICVDITGNRFVENQGKLKYIKRTGHIDLYKKMPAKKGKKTTKSKTTKKAKAPSPKAAAPAPAPAAAKPKNAWMEHLSALWAQWKADKDPRSYKECMQEAKKTYKK